MANDPALSSKEIHLLYVLLDSNLPTGGFVSSSGLESFAKHGFLSVPSSPDPYDTAQSRHDAGASTVPQRGTRNVQEITKGVVGFAEAEVKHYASTTSCFVKEAWDVVNAALQAPCSSSPKSMQEDVCARCEMKSKRQLGAAQDDIPAFNMRAILAHLRALDENHEASLLSHVARRASRSQGVAMLTLYGRGLSAPVGFDIYAEEPTMTEDSSQSARRQEQEQSDKRAKEIIDGYKLLIRKGEAPGHLAVCWGIITSALGLNYGEPLSRRMVGKG